MYHNLKNDGWHIRLFRQILGDLQRRGEYIREIKCNKFQIKDEQYKVKRQVYYHNTSKDAIYGIDFQDQVSPRRITINKVIHYPRVKKILKCFYREGLYTEGPWTKCQPYFYTEKDPETWQKYLQQLRRGSRNNTELYFRGTKCFGQRKHILPKLEIINQKRGKLELEKYIEECCSYKLSLSLPGVANTCHREIEMFGAGVPVLMPIQKTRFNDKLIPDKHYVAVKCDDNKDSPEEVANKITERYYQVIDDNNYLEYVRDNAIKWYDRNILISSRSKVTMSLLGI